MDSEEPPVARSYAKRPSRTLIVVANDERTEPRSASQSNPHPLVVFTEQAHDDRVHILTVVNAQGDSPTVDAWLNLAAEKRLPSTRPVTVFSHQLHCPSYLLSARIDPEIVQPLKCRQCGDPRLASFPFPLVQAPRRKARTSGQLAVFALKR